MSGTVSEINPFTRDESLPIPRSRRGEWTWELVTEFPRQGEWTEDAYLSRTFEGLVEFVDGSLEFLPMVTPFHQDLLLFLYHRMQGVLEGGRRIYLAPLRMQIPGGRYREPDLLVVRDEHVPDRRAPAIGGDFVIEIVSGDAGDRQRDYVDKRADYALARVSEYWIVDPEKEAITVLTLPEMAAEYVLHGEFRTGQTATSVLLPGFSIPVDACFAAGNPPQEPSASSTVA